jgi:hypothetical protein
MGAMEGYRAGASAGPLILGHSIPKLPTPTMLGVDGVGGRRRNSPHDLGRGVW